MPILHVSDTFRPTVNCHGREGFETLWNLEAEKAISSQRTSDVATIRVPLGDGTHLEAYRKRYWYPGWKSPMKGLLRNTFFGSSRAAKEFCNLEVLNRLGCSLVRPIALGEDRTVRFLRRALILTESMRNTIALDRFLADPRETRCPVQRRRRLAAALGNWVRTLHDRGFCDRDFFARNILVHFAEGERFAFSKIDSGAASFGKAQPGSGRLFYRDLADLDRDVRRTVSRSDRLRFLLAYLATSGVDGEVRRLIRELAAFRGVE